MRCRYWTISEGKISLINKFWVFLLLVSYQNIVLGYAPVAPIEEMMAKKDPRLVLQEVEKHKKDFSQSDYLILKSNAFILQKNWKEAVDILEPLYNNDPKNTVLANNFSVALWGIGKKDLAKNILEKNLLSNSPAYRNLRKIYLSNAADSYSKALDGKSNPVQIDLLASTKTGIDIEYFVPPPTNKVPAPLPESTLANNEKPKEDAPKKAPGKKSEMSEKTPAESKKSNNSFEESLEFEPIAKNIRGWASAWSSKNAKEYLSYYSSNFKPEGGISYSEWSLQRTQRVTKPGSISVQVKIINITGSEKKAIAKIYQNYTSSNLKVDVVKYLDFTNEQGKWLITREYNK